MGSIYYGDKYNFSIEEKNKIKEIKEKMKSEII